MSRSHISLRLSDDERGIAERVAIREGTNLSTAIRQGIELLQDRTRTYAKPDPALYPLGSLSKSSIELYLKCPEKWRRRYIENELEPLSGNLIVGKAAGAAEAGNWHQKIESREDLPTSEVLDSYLEEFDQGVHEATDGAGMDFGEDKPGEVKDSGARALTAYHTRIAPIVQPVSVERKFVLEFDNVPWALNGYLDVEYQPLGSEADPRIIDVPAIPGDVKVKTKMLGQKDADSDLQPATYLVARRAEGTLPDRFEFHVATRTKEPKATIITTHRSEAQLDNFIRRVFEIAAEIGWRVETGWWSGAVPGSWWCSENYCGFWHSCPYGGGE